MPVTDTHESHVMTQRKSESHTSVHEPINYIHPYGNPNPGNHRTMRFLCKSYETTGGRTKFHRVQTTHANTAHTQ